MFTELPLIPHTTLLLIRHGQTNWNVQNFEQGGLTDTPLNEKGVAQAEMLAEKIVEIHSDIVSKIYSSDLIRAYGTAKKTADAFESAGIFNPVIVTNKDLREFSWGVLEGNKIPESKKQEYREYSEKLKNDFPSRKERWNHPLVPEKGVESLNQLLERARRALTEICQEHAGKKVAVFTHKKFINALITDAEDMNTDPDTELPNCAVVHFLFDNGNAERPLKYIKTENLLV